MKIFKNYSTYKLMNNILECNKNLILEELNVLLEDLNLTNDKKNMTSTELSLLLENSTSFNEIDKSKLNKNNKSLQSQFIYINKNFENKIAFYYENLNNEYNINSSINNLFIDPRTLKMNCIGHGTGLENKINNLNLIKPINNLIEGHAIYNLKIKGESIEKVEIIILNNKEYIIPFTKVNNEWILTEIFTKSKPFLFSHISWTKFYLKVYRNKNLKKYDKILYTYSTFVFTNELCINILSNKWNFDTITYNNGYIYFEH